MFLEIVSPDAQLFEGKVDSITAPGETGFFQVLNNHAPIVSTLVKGKIKIDISESLNKNFGLIFEKVGNSFYFSLPNGGTFQMNNNRVIIFVDWIFLVSPNQHNLSLWSL